ncbi:glycolate oxidase iron-sulfur subunit [Siccirubricoccus deserti]|uniref:Glycolate oxidase iron-sulfur subunit n=1 Tax=Siccirubricoccus deserti TaxID=2013562 RepID=A0A9X0QUE2_9PROT|nr:glycolate oxidase subunit GlcF [Siccirubricoccus deserti]MBC4013936.1 glycolate oxidase subunit GlcF [Siccirubricoccus deserti]GGC30718.1 glycolate oxidase iron-sulfur subunit [Siccirubricoccus deserti]
MQTSFTPEQLKDADTRESNSILRTCVHCGFCTATCPTFVLLGDELDSPRGRIYLIKDMLESGRPATEEVVRHVDRCLSCLSCMTTCPSGVNYMHLVDHARRYIEETYTRPWPERALRRLLGRLLPYPRRFRLALQGARLARPFAGLIPGGSMTAARLRAMLRLAPRSLPPAGPAARPQIHRAEGERRGRVALLTGCAQQVISPSINEATIRLLTRMGIEVVVTAGQGCCGALNHHLGEHDPAMRLARANIAAWSAELEGEGLDAVVVNASGCGTTVKDYGFMFREEPEPWKRRAAAIAGIAMDISEVLVKFGYAPRREEAPGLTVAYHAACSLQHGQKIIAAPKQLLLRAGFRVKEPAEAHLCCGSAGTYNLLQPEIAGRLRERKLANLERTGADLLAAGNIGCLTQLDGGGLPVAHTVELLDWMAGGPPPPAVEAARQRQASSEAARQSAA